MTVLFLGPSTSPTYGFLQSQQDDVIQTSDRITVDMLEEWNCDFVVSHGYRHILKNTILERFPSRILNLHISQLPWNRGADPNLWSFLENTPSGVSIHLMDTGVDTGPLLLQQVVVFDRSSPVETLATTYEHLQGVVAQLFRENWEALRAGTISPTHQVGDGSFHLSSDKTPYLHLLQAKGYDTPICELVGRAKPSAD